MMEWRKFKRGAKTIWKRLPIRQRIYVVELFMPPFPDGKKSIRVHRRDKTWSVERLSPNCIQWWVVESHSKAGAIAQVIMGYRRTVGKES